MDQGGLLYKNPLFYINDDSEKYKKAEVRLFLDFANALGASGDVQQTAEDVWQFEHELAVVSEWCGSPNLAKEGEP